MEHQSIRCKNRKLQSVFHARPARGGGKIPGASATARAWNLRHPWHSFAVFLTSLCIDVEPNDPFSRSSSSAGLPHEERANALVAPTSSCMDENPGDRLGTRLEPGLDTEESPVHLVEG
jgi:hypothetical protein